MTADATNDLSAFGRHAPRGWLAGLVRAARLCGVDWAGRRLAFALRAVGVRALRGRPLDVESLGARMRLYPGSNVAEKNLLFTPQYFDPEERRLLAAKLAGDFVFIDIGANVGGYALFAAVQGSARARILAIEPQPDIFERLVFNIRQNAHANVKALECAVADRDGEITLFVDNDNKGETSMRLVGTQGAGQQVKVPAKALGTIVAEEGYEHIDAMKLDVEGAEDLILEAFFRDVPSRLWPRILVVEDEPSRWAVDLPRLIVERGYAVILNTRTNVVYERTERVRGPAMPSAVTAAILVIGDEILSGRTKDKNIGTIADVLTGLGIDLREVRIVPDVEDEIVSAVNALRHRYTYLFTTGGIGPTHDDITADSVAKACGVAIGEDPRAIEMLLQRIKPEDLNEARRRMARIPEGADLIRNDISKAPGFMLGNVIVMAGVPAIMQNMLDNVVTRLEGGTRMVADTIDAAGLPEGAYAAGLGAVAKAHPEVSIGSYPSFTPEGFRNQIVVRGRDAAVVGVARAAVVAMLAGLRGDQIPV